MLRWLLAALHLTALGIGLGAVWVRAGALRGPFDSPGLRRIFAADSWWALAGALWIAPVDTSAAPGLARLSYAQAILVLIMVAAATGMARGLGS
jgi:putative membrane protein